MSEYVCNVGINLVNCTLDRAPAPPTDNLHLRNVVSGHAHKATKFNFTQSAVGL